MLNFFEQVQFTEKLPELLLTLCIFVFLVNFAFRLPKYIYYKNAPLAKTIDDMQADGELEGVDIVAALNDIDYSLHKKTYSFQFREICQKQILHKKVKKEEQQS